MESYDHMNGDEPRNPEFLKTVDRVKLAAGRTLLSDEQLLVLTCEEISRTYTHEEKNYQA
jgi:hypothetical protein